MESLEITIICPKCNEQNSLIVSSAADSQPTCQNCGQILFACRAIRGHVYVLSNPKMPGVLKIGMTTRAVEDRVAELNAATGVPASFMIEAYFVTQTPQEHETEVYRSLSTYRLEGKEFFELDVAQALLAIESTIGSPPSYSREQYLPQTEEETSKVTKVKLYCGLCKYEWVTASTKSFSCHKCGSSNVVSI